MDIMKLMLVWGLWNVVKGFWVELCGVIVDFFFVEVFFFVNVGCLGIYYFNDVVNGVKDDVGYFRCLFIVWLLVL